MTLYLERKKYLYPNTHYKICYRAVCLNTCHLLTLFQDSVDRKTDLGRFHVLFSFPNPKLNLHFIYVFAFLKSQFILSHLYTFIFVLISFQLQDANNHLIMALEEVEEREACGIFTCGKAVGQVPFNFISSLA